MDTRTGEIVSMDVVEKLRKEGKREARFFKEIPKELIPKLEGKNRHERRKFYKLHKKEFQSVRRGTR